MIVQLLPVLAMGAGVVALLLFYRPAVVAILFGLAAPIGLFSLPGGIEVINVMSALLVGIAMLVRLQRGLLPLPRKGFAALLAVIWSVGIVISVLLGPSLGKPVIFGTWQILAVLVALAWAEFAGREGEMRGVLIAWLTGATAVALTGTFMSSGGLEAAYGGAVVTGRPVGIFGQPNEYGLFCMLVFVFGLGLAALTRGWVRWLALLAAVTSGMGLLMSLSRGAWVAAAAGVLLLFVMVPQTRRPFVIGGMIVFFGGAALSLLPYQIPFLTVFIERAVSITDQGANPYDLRPLYRAEGLREFAEKPIFGQGPNTFPELSTGIDSYARPGGAEHPHQFVLAVGAEQGLVGLLVILGFGLVVALAARAARRDVVAAHRATRASPAGKPTQLPSLAASVTLCAAAVLLAFVVEGFADYPMRNALSRTTVWVMVGWALAGQYVLAAQRRSRQAAAHGESEQRQPELLGAAP